MSHDHAIRRAAARRQLERAAADTDLDILDGLLDEAHGFRSVVLAAAPHLHTDRARELLRPFADLFDDLMGDTLRAARRAADDARDDAATMRRPGHAA